MTSIRFVGDLPLWAGVLLALFGGLGTWWYYRRESHLLPGRLRWLLPLLRSIVVFLAVLTITGPVLHHKQTIGELGRVLFFVDASQSMDVKDQHMPTPRKLLVAQQQGWLPPGQVETSLWGMANQLADACRKVTADIEGPAPQEETLRRACTSFRGAAEAVGAEIDQFAWTTLPAADNTVVPVWSQVPAQFRGEIIEPTIALSEILADESKSNDNAAQQLQNLCDAAATFEQQLRMAFDLYGSQLAASDNPAITSALALFDDMSRWGRAEHNLLNDNSGLFGQLTENHDIELIGLAGTKAVRLWDPRATPEPLLEIGLAPSAPNTDLRSGVLSEMTSRLDTVDEPASGSVSTKRTAIVLLSDGLHNLGESPLQMAQVFGGQSIPIYTIGYGGWREPPDLALLEVEHPDMVFQKDRIRGTVVLKDQMPPGQSFAVQIQHDDDVLWQEQLNTQDIGLRRVEFEFSVDELVEQLRARFEDEIQFHAFPVALQASITPVNGETETANNVLPLRFTAITQSYQILILDGRSRWEIRYLRNVFQRDEQWRVDTVLVGPGTDQPTLPRGDEADMFPADRKRLFEYDLIIFGEVPSTVFADYEFGWIHDFVEKRGGGIVFIDGNRGQLRTLDEDTIGTLLPVTWTEESINEMPAHLELTEAGVGHSALMLQSTTGTNEQFWKELPRPRQIIPVEAVPGTETLAQATIGERVYPAIVTRSFGAGRVLYFAFDETWRWRYKVADKYHQRFWNQVAKWVMQRPFAVSDEYVSLDTGAPGYQAGESANVRVRLKGTDGRPVNDASVDALLWKDGRMVSVISLTSAESENGIYLGRTGPLPEGDYEVSVRAAGYANDALKARNQFVVSPPRSGELQEVACNTDLLGQLAQVSGGVFLREEEIGTLPDLLRPLSSGHVVESDTLLWQSYWWFSLLIALLAIEWFLRKRAGLL